MSIKSILFILILIVKNLYWTGMLGTSVQVFGGGLLGVWALEVGRELDPGKVIKIKDKEIFYLL